MSDQIRTVDELVNDPLVRLVMASDGVSQAELRAIFEDARERSTEAAFVPPAYVIEACCGRGLCA